MLQLTGVHHVTSITAQPQQNYAFYTQTLGLRLVKKTVNQDDVSAYHLFYADGLASPGSDLTFFHWPLPREQRGTGSLVRTGLRVASEASLSYWQERLKQLGVQHLPIQTRDGRLELAFEDPEGQRLALVVDEVHPQGNPWVPSPVPVQHQILGLGPVTMSVAALDKTDRVLQQVMNLRPVRDYCADSTPVRVYEMGPGGCSAELHVKQEPGLARARSGAGATHHVAFRTPDREQYQAWAEHLTQAGVPASGPVDRFYFRSLYFREPGGILFEIATDGPGFAADEPMESLGQKLSLPPFLESQRPQIERNLVKL
ncbi:ring-cleaving dioxygenase [bacterium]|nr:ring-cleaving dioxygenase [bacterium]